MEIGRGFGCAQCFARADVLTYTDISCHSDPERKRKRRNLLWSQPTWWWLKQIPRFARDDASFIARMIADRLTERPIDRQPPCLLAQPSITVLLVRQNSRPPTLHLRGF